MCRSCHFKYDEHWNDITRASVAAKISERNANPEWKQRVGPKITRSKTGMKYYITKEGRARNSEMHKGNKYAAGKRTPEQCERIRSARWGKKKEK